ncbi:MAG: hypothetical protein JSV85_03255 [Candidatus Bathyarchaeota archaeon]|nr:MAG: hypothetical protein JSV85_03255 [Candidatus Bathyarchaeota archaeon]
MAQQAKRVVLPFAVPARDRKKNFTKRMEMAIVLCLAEMDRVKGGGVVFRRKKPEELAFIAETCYPVWLVPWRGRTLLFDAIGVMNHTLLYETPPDPRIFVNSAQSSSSTREAYSAFLSDNLNYFQNFTDTEENIIEGLITNSDFIQDFVSYLSEAKPIKKPIINKALLTAVIDEPMLSTSIHDFINLRARLGEDIRNLLESMKTLSGITRIHTKTIHRKIGETRKEHNEKISLLKPSITSKERQIQEKRDRKITRASKRFERQLNHLYHERVKLEKTMQSTIAKIERCEAEIRSSKLNKDATGELQWKEDAKASRKRLSSLERKVKETDKRIENVNSAKKQDIFKIRSECDVSCEEATKPLKDLEAARDAQIRIRQQERKSLEDSSSTIIDQINKLVLLKRIALGRLDEIGISQRRRKYALAYVPVYLVCYRRKSKKRYLLYPPSIASSMGIATKFKAVLRSRAKSLLQPRSKPITTFLNQLLTLIEQNPAFENELSNAGTKADILRTRTSRENLEKGLEELKVEGWISEDEIQTYNGLLSKH